MTTPEQNFEQLGLILPPAPKPLGVYMPSLVVGNFLYLSGHGTVTQDGSLIIGRIGEVNEDLLLEDENYSVKTRKVTPIQISVSNEELGVTELVGSSW